MYSLRTKFSLFLVLMCVVPCLMGILTYLDVTQISSNATVVEEMKQAEDVYRLQNKWSDADLAQAQKVRAGLTYKPLQELFSQWIQARSEDSSHLIKVRSEQFEGFLKNLKAELKTNDANLVRQIEINLALVALYALSAAGIAFHYSRVYLFKRIEGLTTELSHFRVVEYQTKLPETLVDDELGNLWTAFYAMVDSLYLDLHADMNSTVDQSKVDVPLKGMAAAIKSEVQKILLERRVAREDRRSQERKDQTERRRA